MQADRMPSLTVLEHQGNAKWVAAERDRLFGARSRDYNKSAGMSFFQNQSQYWAPRRRRVALSLLSCLSSARVSVCLHDFDCRLSCHTTWRRIGSNSNSSVVLFCSTEIIEDHGMMQESSVCRSNVAVLTPAQTYTYRTRTRIYTFVRQVLWLLAMLVSSQPCW